MGEGLEQYDTEWLTARGEAKNIDLIEEGLLIVYPSDESNVVFQPQILDKRFECAFFFASAADQSGEVYMLCF